MPGGPPRTDASAPSQPLRLAAKLEGLRGLVGRGVSPAPANDSARSAEGFDRLLGDVGPRRLVDLLRGAPGCGAALVAFWLAARACRQRGELVVVDPEGVLHPPTAIAWGIDGGRLLWVRPESLRDALAVSEIALRSPAAGGVVAFLGRIDGRAFRRLLLAAEGGEALGVLVRSAEREADPSWADVQLRLDPIPSPERPDAPFLVRVTRRRNRHGPAGGGAILSIDWRTGRIEDVTNRDAGRTSNSNPLAVAPRLAGAAKPA